MPTFAHRPPAHRAAQPWLLALIVATTLGAALLPASGAVAAERTGRATDDVAMRAGPHERAAELLAIPAGTRVAIIGKARKGFYPVDYAGLDGWIATGSLADAVDERDEDGGRRRAAVATEDLNLRAAAGAGEVLRVMPSGGVIEPTGDRVGGFVEVLHEGTEGWVLGKYLSAAEVELPRVPEADAAAPRRPASARPRDYGYSRAEIIGFIYEAAKRYGQSRKAMLRVAQCESELTPTAVNPRTGDSGLFQFNPDTWLTTPYADEDIFDPRASALAAGWMWSVGRRNEWVCQ